MAESPSVDSANPLARGWDDAPQHWLGDRRGWRYFPAWAMSLGLHFTVLLTLGLLIDGDSPYGNEQAEPDRDAGIVLVQRSAGKVNYLSDDDASGSTAAVASPLPTSEARETSLPDLSDLPLTEGPQLPSSAALPSSEPPGKSLIPGASGLTQGAGAPGLGRGHDYDVETGVFGVKGRGSKFVYVFDRSASMSGFEGRPLRAAKRELSASLQSLGGVHQFQIIFYNQKPSLMTFAPGQAATLVFASDEGKKLADNYIRGVVADGGTSHVEALKLALDLRPDVIFFLTDADEPRITRRELDQIRALNHGATINAVEYGAGPRHASRTFLEDLAAQNNGQHRYVDVTKLPRN